MSTNEKEMSYKYPICPECGCNTLVGFTPPKEPTNYELLGKPEYVDWERAHLYCCNGQKNCKYNTRFVDMTTPMTEPKYSLVATSERQLIERVKKAILDYAEPYDGAKWLNLLSPKDIDKILSSLTKDKDTNPN